MPARPVLLTPDRPVPDRPAAARPNLSRRGPARSRWDAGSLLELVRRTAADEGAWLAEVRFTSAVRHWSRLPAPAGAELWLLTWLPDQETDLHDHGPSAAAFTVVQGRLAQTVASPTGALTTSSLTTGETAYLAPGVVHDVRNSSAQPAVSVHAYSPPLATMAYYEAARDGLRRVRTVVSDQPEQA